MEVHILGIDIAKRVFSLHGVDRRGNKLIKKTLTGKELLPFVGKLSRCIVAIEPCERIGEIRGVGPITATAMIGALGDPWVYKKASVFPASGRKS